MRGITLFPPEKGFPRVTAPTKLISVGGTCGMIQLDLFDHIGKQPHFIPVISDNVRASAGDPVQMFGETQSYRTGLITKKRLPV